MKFTSVVILFTCLLAATFSKWAMIASYELNKSYIATELCVNKNNTTAHCNGHCFLNRQMNSQEKPGTPCNIPSSEKFAVHLFFEATDDILVSPSAITMVRTPAGQHLFSRPSLQAAFHPPKAIRA